MSALATFRTERGLTLEQMAVELGLSPKSRGWLSEIERGVTDASLRLALRIERWTEGAVPAASVCAELRDEIGHRPSPQPVDADTLPEPGSPVTDAKSEPVQ